METFLIRAVQLMLSLSILVIIHEGGHFLFARLFKIRVEKFCLFFDPWFTLFKFKPKNSETTYGVGWLPLGGYVKIAGMIDESMDTDQMKQPEQPWEFRSKPAWQRLLVMIAGVLFNFLLALFIYSMVLFAWGDSYIPLKKMSYGMEFSEQAKQIGFRDRDILLSADGKEFDRFGIDMIRTIIGAREVTVIRDGKQKQVYIPDGLSLLDIAKEDPPFIDLYIPSVVDSVVAGKPGALAGLQKGDSLVTMNNMPLASWSALSAKLDSLKEMAKVHKEKDFSNVQLVVARAGALDTLSLKLDSAFRVGATAKIPDYKPEVLTYGFYASFPAGINHGIHVLRGYVDDMKYVFTKEGANSLGGFGTIGSIFPKVWDWHRFWEMTAFLSIILAFMNILPIPALDGGHVLFLLYEIVARRKPSEKFMERAQIIGMSFLILLLIWANFNDVLRFLF